jgi:HK97 family phage prohead protease
MKKPTQAELDLEGAIRGAVRADASFDIARRHIAREAESLKLSELIPENWREDGSLKNAAGVWSTSELRDTANDVFTALEGAISDLYEGEYSYYAWVQDWYGGGTTEEPYIVVFRAGGELYAAEFTYDDDQKIEIGEKVKVRPITLYVEREQKASPEKRTAAHDLEWRKSKARSLGKGTPERRDVFELTSISAEVELRADGEDEGVLVLTGYASVTGTPYDVGFYQETVERGAFKRTLSNSDLDVQLLVNHIGLPLARTTSGTLTLSENEKGLLVRAELDPEDPDVRSLAPKMRRGDVTEMSFAFRVLDQEWSDDYTERSLTSLDIHRGDVSVVSYGASPTTSTTLRSEEANEFIATVERRSGESLPAAAKRQLFADLTGQEPTEVEEEQREVPSPTPLVIPDYTKRARLQLAALGVRR